MLLIAKNLKTFSYWCLHFLWRVLPHSRLLRWHNLLDRAYIWSILVVPSWILDSYLLTMNTSCNCWNFRSQAQRGKTEDASLSTHLPPTPLADFWQGGVCVQNVLHQPWCIDTVGHSDSWKWNHWLYGGSHWSHFVPHNFVVWHVQCSKKKSVRVSWCNMSLVVSATPPLPNVWHLHVELLRLVWEYLVKVPFSILIV